MSKFAAIRKALVARHLERHDVVDGALVALLSGEPMFILGPPGTGKSALCNDIAACISGDYFSWMLTKFTVPEELFGPLSLKGLEQDRYRRDTKGKLPSSHVVFIDEVGKASSSISNTLLTCMNEHVFFNDGQAEKIPMLAMFGASNEIPQAEELGAFFDRFVLRYTVAYVEEEASADALFQGINRPKLPSITVKEVESERAKAMALPVPKRTVDCYKQIRRAVKGEGLQVSDRKWVQASRVARAWAYLNDHSEVEPSDLEILSALLWSQPEQIAQARTLVLKIVNPIAEKITQILDAVNALPKTFSDEQAVELYKKVMTSFKHLRDLEGLKKGATPQDAKNAKLREAMEFVLKVAGEIRDKSLSDELED